MPVSFGPGGQLVCVSPSSPSDGQTALVELHSMEVNKILCPLNVSTLLPAPLCLSPGISMNLLEGPEPYTLWIGVYVCGKGMRQGTDLLQGLYERILKVNTGLGIVPIPTNQGGKLHN